MIEAKNLSKRYEDGVLALDALNLNVKPGEIYCLLGANGAGKTTTINLFLNFIEPTSGAALLNGIDVEKDPLDAKRYVAYVSENVMLYGNFTARQNLDFFAKLGGKKSLKKDDYYRVMREVGLPERAFEQRLKEFSKGMRQKLGIAIAMLIANAMSVSTLQWGLMPILRKVLGRWLKANSRKKRLSTKATSTWHASPSRRRCRAATAAAR